MRLSCKNALFIKKIVYKGYSSPSGILWQSKSFLNIFSFNCVNIIANLSIFHVLTSAKRFKSIYLSNKKCYEENQTLYQISSWTRFLSNTFSFDCLNILFISLHQQKNEMCISQQRKVVWERLAPLWNPLVNYILVKYY